MSRSWAGGSTRAWRRRRARVLLRNLDEHDGRCQLALPGTWHTAAGELRRCLGRADCVHHVDGKRNGDSGRLVAACAPCNLKVGDPTRSTRPEPDPRGRSRTQWHSD